MRKIFLIGIKDVKIRTRDLSSFIMLLVMPLILILVLGMATVFFSLGVFRLRMKGVKVD